MMSNVLLQTNGYQISRVVTSTFLKIISKTVCEFSHKMYSTNHTISFWANRADLTEVVGGVCLLKCWYISYKTFNFMQL